MKGKPVCRFRHTVLADFYGVELPPSQYFLNEFLRKPDVLREALNRHTFTAYREDTGRILAVAGIHSGGHAHGVAWAWFSAGLGSAIVPILRRIRKELTYFALRHGAVTCKVLPGHYNAQRLARLLGFRKVGDDVWVLHRRDASGFSPVLK